ncbi:MAG: hypothetical protein V3W41_18955 [Planctomycetota bacterium]
MPSTALLLALCYFCVPISGQVVSKGKPNPSQPRVPSFKDGTPLFEKAKAKQCNSKLAPKITSFEGDFDVSMNDYSKPGTVTKLKGHIRQYWAKRPRKIGKETTFQTAYRRELSTDLATETQVLSADWDNTCWRQKVLGKKTKKPVYMNNSKDRQDETNLLAEKRRVNELFGLLLLNQLDLVPDSIKLEAENQAISIKVGQRPFNSLASRLSFSDRRGYSFRLWIDQKTLHPVRAQVRWPKRKNWEQFDLAQHFEATLPDGKTKIFVPCNIVYYQNGRPTLEATTQYPNKAFRFNGLDEKRLLQLFPEDEDF